MNFSARTGGQGRWPERIWRTGRLAGFSVLCGAMAGCQTAPLHTGIFQRDFRPDNVFVQPQKLSPDFRRVAVLPIAAASTGDLPAGCEALTAVLWEQLVKTKKFETVAVDPDKLRRLTGRAAWTGTEALPPDFFATLRREYGCDGVLFVELTAYRAYAPLAVGWRFKLVGAGTTQIIWSADELFDATQSAVASAAQHFEKKPPVLSLATGQDWAMENSPRRFGRYSAATLLDTLPPR